MATVSNQAPVYLIAHYFWTYAITSTRPLKGFYGLDHNVNPREDIDRFGDKAVAKGKITQSQLNRLKRNSAAHENTIDQFPFFIGSIILATVAKVPNEKINRTCQIYSVARVVYHVLYLSLEKVRFTWMRSVVWWVGNLSCIWLLWQCKKELA